MSFTIRDNVNELIVTSSESAKTYSDNIIASGPMTIQAVKCASNTNITLTLVVTGIYSLTNLSIDSAGILSVNDRILLFNQTDKTQNGVWKVDSVISTIVQLSRPIDYAHGAVMRTGTRIAVTSGTSFNGKVFENVSPQVDAFTGLRVVNYIGTANQTWGILSSTTAFAGDGNGNVVCNAHLKMDDWYRYIYLLGGNQRMVIGGDFIANGDGVSFGYNWNPNNTKRGTYHATRMFIGYTEIKFDYAPNSSDMTGRFTTLITEGGLNRVRSINLYPMSDNGASLGSSGYRWSQLYATTSTIATSDERDKTDIIQLNNREALDILMKLHPVSYRWKPEFSNSGRKHTGFISQQVELDLGTQVASDWGFFIHSPSYTETKDVSPEEKVTEYYPDKYGLRYEELISPLVGSVQCLASRVDSLEQSQTACVECVSLKSQLLSLELRIQTIENYLTKLNRNPLF